MIRSLFLIVLFLLFPLFTFGRLSASAAVVINEILPKPTVETEEWIELYNNGPSPVSLAGWILENTQGDAKTYTIADGVVIPANGFWSFDRTQTGINLSNEGDTVKLFDNSAYQVDSQSYPSILGYNTSVGRSDAGAWTTCTTWTKSLPNKCPNPTSTPTPTLTPIPTRKPTPSPSITPTTIPIESTPTSTPLFTTANQPAQSQILGVMETPITSEPPIYRWLGITSFCIAGIAALGLIIRQYRARRKN